ncbi:predicted protein [Methanosarcina acetivorans C2A]|uniref:Uncharacterized protein n=2 Tax=Methanosarcina acetivorans TaxID=2214 RepID=Q8TNQ7_METAC|nr:predicted protein [Methanosarcina acetivorans C2A]
MILQVWIQRKAFHQGAAAISLQAKTRTFPSPMVLQVLEHYFPENSLSKIPLKNTINKHSQNMPMFFSQFFYIHPAILKIYQCIKEHD